MNDTVAMSFRMPREVLRYLKVRAAKNDRSANKELTALLRNLQKKEAEESQLGGKNSSASEQSVKETNQ
ncbi:MULTISPECIES: Arc family DNA-binding protein [unclassified Saccharibacter]|uniref:Arc family DNA-binding protein n=1 Tax=unclassified Saccharibacter TaxID=2648722 RepID=UPI00135323FF|nr:MULTISPECIES: Arc family DNA-binding protein [unclassified Saccharibacter]MXV58354.1 Arc family DNA-binding protein [Saccharibacter sp. EH70]MXV65798.1 Arc family DNA-binding protein [Saccharibacter sp. EH60]